MKNFLLFSLILVLPGCMTAGPNLNRSSSKSILETVRHYVDAHNSRSVEAIVSEFPESLDVRNFRPDGTFEKYVYDKAEQRARFADSTKYVPKAHSEIISAIVSEPFVITRELNTGMTSVKSQYAVIMYKVADNKIAAIWILTEEEPESRQ